jgi:hypothetical protein
MRGSNKAIFALGAVGVLLIGIAVSGLFLFNQKPQQGFGIYLSHNNQVVLTDEDVVWYNKSSHQMNLIEQ